MPNNSKIVRDPIHGNIKINDIFLNLLETPEIQRLHNIKQLGLSHLVFPGANHTRLEHSLGVYEVVSKASQILNLENEEELIIKCAAILHDIGHGPFSHTLESILQSTLNVDHISITEKLILGKIEIYTEEEKSNILFKNVFDILNKYDINLNDLTDIIKGDLNKKPYLSQILNSAIDADQLDYLIRDAYYTGVAYGFIDIERFLQTLTIMDNKLMILKKGVGVTENILVARSLMYSSVYFHKTVRIAELMLSRAIELQKDTNPDIFFKMTDGELMNYLSKMDSYQSQIATYLKYRNLFKQSYAAFINDLDSDRLEVIKELEDIENRKNKEREMEEILNIPNGHVIIDVPYQELHQAEPRIIKTDLTVVDKNKYRTLDELTPVASAIRSRIIPDWMIMVATDKKYQKKLSEKAEKILFK